MPRGLGFGGSNKPATRVMSDDGLGCGGSVVRKESGEERKKGFKTFFFFFWGGVLVCLEDF